MTTIEANVKIDLGKLHLQYITSSKSHLRFNLLQIPRRSTSLLDPALIHIGACFEGSSFQETTVVGQSHAKQYGNKNIAIHIL